MRARFVVLAALLLLGGCASTPPPGPPTPATRTGMAETLAVERQWLLEAWFKGTPVRIAQRPDGAIDIDVPREFCFDPGRSSVKPALAAVLDKLAESLRRVPLAYVSLIAAPGDSAAAPPSLAQQRAQQVHDQLRSRGVAAARLGSPVETTAAAVHLRVAGAAP